MARIGFAAGLALLLLLGSIGLWLVPLALPSGAAAPGLVIAGAPVPSADTPWRAAVERLRGGSVGSAGLEALVRQLARRIEAAPVALSAEAALPGVQLGATLADLGVRVDEVLTLERARAVGRRGSPLERRAELERARRGAIDVPLELVFERAVFYARHAALKQEIDRRAVAARFPMARGALVPDVPGRALDLEAAADALWSHAVERASRIGDAQPLEPLTIDVPVVGLVARVNAAAFGSFAPRVELADYSTRFRTRGDQATRARNIGLPPRASTG